MKRFAASTRKVGAARLVVDSLKRVSLTFIGDDHQLNYAVAKVVGSRLGWFPVDGLKVMTGMRKVPDLAALTEPERVATEAELLRGLRNQFRVIATPLPAGAVLQDAVWKDLWGSVIVWIDEDDKSTPKPRTPERQLYEDRAELAVRVKVQKGFGVRGGQTLEGRARAVADTLLPRLSDFLAEKPELTERKRQYVERGCRGDWPELQPAEGSPVVAALDRKPLAGFEEEQSSSRGRASRSSRSVGAGAGGCGRSSSGRLGRPHGRTGGGALGGARWSWMEAGRGGRGGKIHSLEERLEVALGREETSNEESETAIRRAMLMPGGE
eukprot:XP_001697857.1 shikimate kinase-related protein [Chlamydomonas reinhardtii]